VLHGTASFDTVPPDADFWRSKIADIAERGWPFLVAEETDAVVGYAYATQFRDRPAMPKPARTAFTSHPSSRAAASAPT